MITYQEQIQKAVAGEVIPSFWLGYFREAYREDLNDQFVQLCDALEMSKAALARKIGRRPEQVTRWFNSPSNLEADTVSDLALACGFRPVTRLERITFPSSSKKAATAPAQAAPTGNVVAVDFGAGSVLSSTASSTAFASQFEMAANG